MSTAWPVHPVIYEVNTAIWLREVGHRLGRPVTLGEVPGTVWDELTLPGVDAVWLMGVWERSPAGLAIAMADPALQASFRDALPDLRPDDVVGSPYCVRRYVVDEGIGGREGLAAARAELARRGVRLLLDYVPNHVAPDHPWAVDHPEYFVRGGSAEREQEPKAYVEVGGNLLALGRDPYFPPWPDVVQLDAFAEPLRRATAEMLVSVGDQCDGVRCDMAMLLMNDIFGKTWGHRAGPAPVEDFWPEIIGLVRSRHPDMMFAAEAYWDLEWALQQQGFDYCYDKRLYDRMLGEDAGSVRAHLGAELDYQGRLVRFLENHDEPRAAETMPADKQRAAAVAVATLPGATLWHEGQFEGRRVRPPVFLARRPSEPADPALREFYHRLVAAVGRSAMRTGRWQLLASTGWPDNPSCENVLAWAWDRGQARSVVVVNFSADPAQAHVPLPWPDLGGRTCRLDDELGDNSFDRDGDELLSPGLFVSLEPWRWHVLSVWR